MFRLNLLIIIAIVTLNGCLSYSFHDKKKQKTVKKVKKMKKFNYYRDFYQDEDNFIVKKRGKTEIKKKRTKIIYKNLPKLTTKFDKIICEYSKKYKIDYRLLKVLIKVESNYKIKAYSNKKARGLMQLLLPTAKDYRKNISSKQLYNPKINIQIGSKHFKRLKTKYNSYKTAIMVYNIGEGNYRKCKKGDKKYCKAGKIYLNFLKNGLKKYYGIDILDLSDDKSCFNSKKLGFSEKIELF